MKTLRALRSGHHLLLAILCLALPSSVRPVLAAPSGPPIEVFADSVEVDLEAQTTSFKQNVRVLFDPWQARCQQAQVFLDPKSRQVTRIVMQGNVLVQRGTSILKGQKVTLDVRANRLKIEGQVYTRMQFERPINLKMN
jgi:lipopolysaccharide export system protein LptA